MSGRVQEIALGRKGDAGDRVRSAGRRDRRALKRVKGDVNLRSLTGSNLFTDVKHGSFVPLALPDHHGAINIQHVQSGSHRINGGLISGLLIAPPHPAHAGDRRDLSDTHGLQGKIAIFTLIVGHGFQISLSTSRTHRGPVCCSKRLQSFDADHARRFQNRIERIDSVQHIDHVGFDSFMGRQHDRNSLVRGFWARWISASIETLWSRMRAETSARTPGRSTTINRM